LCLVTEEAKEKPSSQGPFSYELKKVKSPLGHFPFILLKSTLLKYNLQKYEELRDKDGHCKCIKCKKLISDQ
jgi:hypothetical protein